MDEGQQRVIISDFNFGCFLTCLFRMPLFLAAFLLVLVRSLSTCI